MPDKFLVRRKLLEQLGRRRFIKFVQSISRTLDERPLRYWQEEAWATFCEANPDLAMPTEYLPYVLRVCLIHWLDLELFPVPTTGAWIDYEPIANPPLIRPAAPPQVMMLGERAKTVPVVPYWACPACAKLARERSGKLPGWLAR